MIPRNLKMLGIGDALSHVIQVRGETYNPSLRYGEVVR